MFTFAGWMFLVAITPSIQKSSLDEVAFMSIVSSASTQNKTIAWAFAGTYPSKKFALIYDFEKNTCLEVYDERVKLSLFSSVIPDGDSFVVVDNTTGKFGRFDFNGQLRDNGFIKHWEGYADLAVASSMRVCPSQDGVGVATYDNQSGQRVCALIDFKNKQVKNIGVLPAGKDKEQYVIGANGQHYLVEPGLGVVSLFDLATNQKGLTVYQDPYAPAYAKMQVDPEKHKMSLKAVSNLTFNGALSLQFNHYYDETGARRQDELGFVTSHGVIDGANLKKTAVCVVGANDDGTQFLAYHPEDRELHLKNQTDL